MQSSFDFPAYANTLHLSDTHIHTHTYTLPPTSISSLVKIRKQPPQSNQKEKDEVAHRHGSKVCSSFPPINVTLRAGHSGQLLPGAVMEPHAPPPQLSCAEVASVTVVMGWPIPCS